MELELSLIDICNKLNLKQKAYVNLEKIFPESVDNSEDDLLNGFNKTEIEIVFDRFEFQVGKENSGSLIKTRIGLYVIDNKNIWVNNLEPIGYYELETDFNGEFLDEYFVIEKQKYLKDIDINGYFQKLNQKMPKKHLRRNHGEYEYVTYVSFIGSLILSLDFESAGVFVSRAYNYLKTKKVDFLDDDYFRESKIYLDKIYDYLVERKLLTNETVKLININKNCG